MNEKELSALIDELMSEKRAKQGTPSPETEAETALAEEIAAEVAEAEEAAPVSHAASEGDVLPEESEPAPEESPEVPEDESAEPEDAPEKPSPRGRISAALDAQPEPADDPLPRKGHRTRDILTGLVLVLLAAYGLFALVQRGIDRARLLTSNTVTEDAVKETLLPLVLTDMPDFADPSALTDDQFMTAAIWAAITQGRLAEFPQSFDMYTVPAETLTAIGNRLFAVNRDPSCHTIGFSGELRFYYDAEADTYLLPADPELFTYEPVIREMTEQPDGQYLVTVDYAAEQPAWNTAEPRIIKTVQYTVQHGDGGWAVRASQQVSEQKEGFS